MAWTRDDNDTVACQVPTIAIQPGEWQAQAISQDAAADLPKPDVLLVRGRRCERIAVREQIDAYHRSARPDDVNRRARGRIPNPHCVVVIGGGQNLCSVLRPANRSDLAV